MITALTQETITPYAPEAQTTQEPQGADYIQGVKVGRTIPAKWWNWLFNAGTKRLAQAKNDAQDMLTEMQNVVTDAGITLDGSDSTQLRQAVISEADKQIDNYVDSKRAFMRLWNKVSKPGAFGELGYVDNMCQVGNLCLMSIAGGSVQWTSRIIVSTDMLHWNTVYTSSEILRNNFVAVYHNNRYFIATYKRNNDTLSIVVLSSVDGIDWTSIYEFAPSGTNKGYGIFLGVLDSALYLIGDSSVYKLNAEGSTFVATSMSYPLPNSSALQSEPMYLGNHKYLIGTAIIDASTDTLTVVTGTGGSSFYHGFCDNTFGMQYYNNTDGTVTLRLINGTYLIVETDVNNRRRKRYTVINSSGEVLSQDIVQVPTYGSGYTPFLALYNSRDYPTYLFIKGDIQTTPTSTSTVLYYTVDPVHYTSHRLPFNGENVNVTQVGDTFFVYDGQHSIYRIEGALSDNANDYILVTNSVPVVGSNTYPVFLNTGIPNTLALTFSPPRNGACVSRDNGVNWEPSTTADGDYFAGFACVLIAGEAYATPDFTIPYQHRNDDPVYLSTGAAVNRVSGHTLYLR